eukprot:4347633-Alexandrium_andersonii.AAC.1
MRACHAALPAAPHSRRHGSTVLRKAALTSAQSASGSVRGANLEAVAENLFFLRPGSCNHKRRGVSEAGRSGCHRVTEGGKASAHLTTNRCGMHVDCVGTL